MRNKLFAAMVFTSQNQPIEKVVENLQKKDEFLGISNHELKMPFISIKSTSTHCIYQKFSAGSYS